MRQRHGSVRPGRQSRPGARLWCALAAKDTLAGAATLNWSADTALTGWDGITTGGTPGRVTELELESSSLTGSIPASLGRLWELQSLRLGTNSLAGPMPRELGLLTNLTHLYLGNNQLTGEISGSLDDLTTLSLVRLAGGNSFTRCIQVGLQSVADHDLGDLGLPYCAPAASLRSRIGIVLSRLVSFRQSFPVTQPYLGPPPTSTAVFGVY